MAADAKPTKLTRHDLNKLGKTQSEDAPVAMRLWTMV